MVDEPAGAGVVVVLVDGAGAAPPGWVDGVVPVVGLAPAVPGAVPGAVPVDDVEPAPLLDGEVVVDGLVVLDGLVLVDWFEPVPLVSLGWVDEVLLSVQPTSSVSATPADSRRGFFMEWSCDGGTDDEAPATRRRGRKS
ncbi:MAG: hypothetical protein H0X45_16740 [Planctomycetes bacterium]|nr:hypothetical protein [Planctomycetota bacterium]